MRVLLTLAVCGPWIALALSHSVHERKTHSTKVKHGVGAQPHHHPVFLDRSTRLTGVEAAVRAQRLDQDEDMRTKELMSQIGKMEGELEDAQETNIHLNRRIAKEEVSFAQNEEKFQRQVFQAQREMKIADDWVWRLEMGFIAQFLVALVLGLSCLLCHCQICKEPCGPCSLVKTVDKDQSLHAKWNASHRPMDPDLKEKLRIRRMKVDGVPVNPPKQDGSLAGAPADKSCAYYSMTEGENSEVEEAVATPRSSAFPAVFSESEAQRLQQVPVPAGATSPTSIEDSWWGSHSPR